MRKLRTVFSFLAGAVFLSALALPVNADLLDFGGTADVDTGETGTLQYPLWYMDANSLRLQACLDEAVSEEEDFCLAALGVIQDEDGNPIIADLEFFYFLAEAQIQNFPQQPGAGDSNTRVRLIMALEAAVDFVDEAETVQGPVVFNSIIITGRGFSPNTIYSFTTPYGNFEVPTDNRGRMGIELPDPHPEGNSQELFAAALQGAIQKFVYWDSDLPQTNAEGAFYLGNPAIEDPATAAAGHTIFGSPFGTNYLRVTGPNNFDIRTDLFTIVGKVFYNENQNLPPSANLDVVATRPGEAVTIDVLANDELQGDVPINPTSLEKTGAVATVSGGTVTAVRELDKVLLRFTPGAGFNQRGGFTYTAETFTGQSGTANVAVFVEDLRINAADYRARTGRWAIEGTSSIVDLVVPFMEDGVDKTAYMTSMTGAQEVPPRTTTASGEFAAVFTQNVSDSFDYHLTVNVPQGTEITQAHIHAGETGINGPVILFLCTNLGNAPAGTTVPPCTPVDGVINVRGALSANELQAAGDITTFAQAVQAIQEGRTYVNVHSAQFPPGEIRGQIGVNVISLHAGQNGPAVGAAEVQTGGAWSFSGKSVGAPGAEPHMIHAESSLGITETRDLRLR